MQQRNAELTFEAITEADIPELTDVMTRAFDDDAQKYLGRERGGPDGYKAVRAGKIVGAIIVWILPERHNIVGTIFVDPALQDQGIGTAIWRFIETRYPETESWRLGTPTWATKNHHFYADKCGFRRVESDPIIGAPDDTFVYVKEMAA